MRALWVALVGLAMLAAPFAQAAPLAPTAHATICFLDIDGDGLRSLDEPAFLQVSCPGGLAPGDVRLSPWQGRAGGTLVHGEHDDAGLLTTPIGATYAFHDADGSGAYNLNDPLFVTFGPPPGQARAGDLPLTGDDAFHSLRIGDSRLGLPLLAAPVAVGGESFSEVDGNPGFTTGDIVYLDLDGSGQTSLGDLRLAVPAPDDETSTTTSSAATTPPSTAPTTPPSTEPIPSPTPASPPAPSSSPDSRGVPAAGFLPALLAMVLLALRRPPHQGI